MPRTLDDIPNGLTLFSGETQDFAVFIRDRDGNPIDVTSGFTAVRVSITDIAGNAILIDRQLGSGATLTTVDGITGVLCDTPSVGEWTTLPTGIYVGQLWIKDASSDWHTTEFFRVRVMEPIGGSV